MGVAGFRSLCALCALCVLRGNATAQQGVANSFQGGPDLTNLAGTRKTASIVDALTKPLHKVFGDGGAIPKILIPNTTYQPVRVTAADGTVITGVLKNEDSYALQVMGTDNRLHMFDRARVKVVYETRTLMPTDYDKRLAPDEFRNLLAYLTRLHVPAPS